MKTIGEIRFLNVTETAEILGLCTHTIRRYLKEGKIPSTQLGRTHIKVSDICEVFGLQDSDFDKYFEK